MALDAPLHQQRLVLVGQVHLVDFTVAGVTADTLGHVDRVIEVRVVRQVMHAFPRNRLVLLKAFANRPEHFRAGPHLLMAVHAGLRRRDACEGRGLHTRVAIPAIDAQFTHVMLVTERHGLIDDIAFAGDVGRSVDNGPAEDRADEKQGEAEHGDPCDRVHAAVENLGHQDHPSWQTSQRTVRPA